MPEPSSWCASAPLNRSSPASACASARATSTACVLLARSSHQPSGVLNRRGTERAAWTAPSRLGRLGRRMSRCSGAVKDTRDRTCRPEETQHAPARVPLVYAPFPIPIARHWSDVSPTLIRHLIRHKSDTYCRPMRKSPDATDALAALAQASGRGHGRRSPVYLWFRQHHDELAAGFARYAPAWQVLAAFLGQQGILDIDGKPPTARGVRDAWWRVRRDVEAAAGTATPLPAPSAPSRSMTPQGGRAVVEFSPSLPVPQPGAVPELPPLADDRPRMPRPKFRTPK